MLAELYWIGKRFGVIGDHSIQSLWVPSTGGDLDRNSRWRQSRESFRFIGRVVIELHSQGSAVLFVAFEVPEGAGKLQRFGERRRLHDRNGILVSVRDINTRAITVYNTK